MKILFVTPYIPSHVRVRPFAFIRELAAQGHQVTLVCLVQPAHEIAYLEDVRPYCEKVYSIPTVAIRSALQAIFSLPGRYPLSVAYSLNREFSQTVAQLAGQDRFDILHTEFIRAAPATADLQCRPKVFDAVDSLGLAYRRSLQAPDLSLKQRAISTVEAPKTSRYERSLMSKYDAVFVSSPVDGAEICPADSRAVHVVRNGVDLEYFCFDDRPRDPDTIVFVGKMSYYVNVVSMLWFYHQVFPLLQKQRPNIRLVIVGREPSPQIQALSTQPGVVVTGTVPDVRPYLTQAALAICPMVAGSGTQNKMLEAMACGTPCVCTSISTQSLEVSSERDVLIANEPIEFAGAVLRCLDDADLNHTLTQNARAYVERYHAWSTIGLEVNRIYTALSR